MNITNQKVLLLTACMYAGAALSVSSALADRQSDPNLGHFYMARQQVTITDDGPVIINRQGGAGQPGGNGALPPGPVGLPKAGWVPYSQSVPGLSTSLPKTNNGVPQKAPPAPPHALKARPGNLKGGPKAAVAPKASSPQEVQSYAPYKSYPSEQSTGGMAANSSSANVRGSVLHWARQARRSY